MAVLATLVVVLAPATVGWAWAAWSSVAAAGPAASAMRLAMMGGRAVGWRPAAQWAEGVWSAPGTGLQEKARWWLGGGGRAVGVNWAAVDVVVEGRPVASVRGRCTQLLQGGRLGDLDCH